MCSYHASMIFTAAAARCPYPWLPLFFPPPRRPRYPPGRKGVHVAEEFHEDSVACGGKHAAISGIVQERVAAASQRPFRRAPRFICQVLATAFVRRLFENAVFLLRCRRSASVWRLLSPARTAAANHRVHSEVSSGRVRSSLESFRKAAAASTC